MKYFLVDRVTHEVKRVTLTDLITYDADGDLPKPKPKEDLVYDNNYSYALTYNINTNEFINRKKWGLYSKDKQQLILHKKLLAFARGCQGIVTEMVYEKCPHTQQQHIHASIETRDYLKMRYIELMNKKYKVNGYSTIKVEPIYDAEGWRRYLKKNET